MSQPHMPLAARILIAALPLVLVAGCPVNPDVVDSGAGQSSTVPYRTSLAGDYWAEYADGTLAIFELPRYRGAAGAWLTAATPQPEWYTGPALYEVKEDGTWTRLTSDANLTLDDIIQLYDPPPAVEDSPSGALAPP